MKPVILLLAGIVIACLISAGCTRPVAMAPAAPDVPAAPPVTPVPASSLVTAPEPPGQVVTIIHRISQTRAIRDADLLFALQVPVEWDVTTTRLAGTDEDGGPAWETSLIRDRFSIFTYPATRSQDQGYRDLFRQWSPAPVESTVTINGITFDRFESSRTGLVSVGYVARKNSANERGYASVILFVANTSNRFEKDDLEQVVSSFRYYSAHDADVVPGEEIPRLAPPADSTGGAKSATAASGAGAPGSGCSRCGSA